MRLRADVDEGGPGGHGWGVATALRREDLRFLVGLALCAWCSGRVLQVEDRGVRSEDATSLAEMLRRCGCGMDRRRILKVVRAVKGRTEEEDVAESRMVLLVAGEMTGHDVAGERI
jgi:hypothetical protein